jgi:hypothetical protein
LSEFADAFFAAENGPAERWPLSSIAYQPSLMPRMSDWLSSM